MKIANTKAVENEKQVKEKRIQNNENKDNNNINTSKTTTKKGEQDYVIKPADAALSAEELKLK
eukprot:Pgem_evm1s9047